MAPPHLAFATHNPAPGESAYKGPRGLHGTSSQVEAPCSDVHLDRARLESAQATQDGTHLHREQRMRRTVQMETATVREGFAAALRVARAARGTFQTI